MNQIISPSICCPECDGLINLTKGNNCCECEASYATEEGYLDLLPEEDFYWGEIPRELMQSILTAAKENGSKQALLKLKEVKPNTYDFVTRANRIDWINLIGDLPDNFTAVDLGSGWGSISIPLSKIAGQVISIEATRERAQWQQLRKKELSLNNLQVIHGNVLETKLPSNSVDLIVANGLVEWVGLMSEGPVDKVYEGFINEMMRILKPSGYFYCGIENRFMAYAFLGERDHSGYSFTNIMPRWMADSYCKLRSPAKYLTEEKMNGYRTYTYSYWGWKSFLNKAGFSDVDIYGLLPTYNNIELQCGLERGEILRFCIDNFIGTNTLKRRIFTSLGKVACHLGLQKLLHPYFGVVARKPSLDMEPNNLHQPDIIRSKATGAKITSFFFKDSDSQPKTVRKTVRFPEQISLLDKEISCLKLVEELDTASIPVKLPRVLDIQRDGRLPIFDQEYLGGVTLSKHLEEAGLSVDQLSRHDPVVNGFMLLESLSQQSVPQARKAKHYAINIVDSFKAVAALDDGLCGSFLEVLESVLADPLWDEIKCAPFHGDFSPSNLLFENEKVSAILDWEYYCPESLPLLDSFFFALTCVGFSSENMTAGSGDNVNPLSARYVRSFDLCFFQSNGFSDAFTEHIHTVCKENDQPQSIVKLMMPLFIADIATRFLPDDADGLDPRFNSLISRYIEIRGKILI